MATTLPLSDVQVRKLAELNAAAETAALVAQQAQQGALQARQRLNDMVEVVLDAHGAPATSTIDLQNGVVVLSDGPAEEIPSA